MHYICKDCGKQFEITPSEAEFYKSKGLSLPKRCKECREKNKAAKAGSQGPKPSQGGAQNRGGGNGNRGSKRGKGGIAGVAVLLLALIIGLVFGGKSLLGNDNFNDLSEKTTAAESSVSAESTTSADIFSPDEYTSAYTSSGETVVTTEYSFRNGSLLEEHYKKHGIEMGFDSPEEYEEAACAVINNPDALTKTEAEDGDFVYYLEDTNEFVILSTDGYIRTYFNPSDGLDYFNRQ